MKEENTTQKQNAFIAIGGLSGSGKSTVARILEQDLQNSGYDTVRLNSDEVRKELWGVSNSELLPKEAYTREFSLKTYEEVDIRIKDALDKGQSVIVDIVFVSEAGRAKMENFAKDYGASFTAFWLDAPAQVLKDRVISRAAIGGDPSDADADIVDLQQTFNLGHIEWPLIDATRPLVDVYDDVSNLLRKHAIELQQNESEPQNRTYLHKNNKI